MSLDALDAQIDGYRTQAKNLLDNYNQTQADVAADPNLTDAGKLEALKPLHDEISTKVSALRAEEKSAITRKREALEKTLFGIQAGNSSDIVSYRDAQDRATRILDPREAQTAYTNALRSDDTMLAKAILAQALTYGWTSITNDYRTRNPSAATALNDLNRIAQYENDGFMSLLHYIVPTLSTARPTSARR